MPVLTDGPRRTHRGPDLSSPGDEPVTDGRPTSQSSRVKCARHLGRKRPTSIQSATTDGLRSPDTAEPAMRARLGVLSRPDRPTQLTEHSTDSSSDVADSGRRPNAHEPDQLDQPAQLDQARDTWPQLPQTPSPASPIREGPACDDHNPPPAAEVTGDLIRFALAQLHLDELDPDAGRPVYEARCPASTTTSCSEPPWRSPSTIDSYRRAELCGVRWADIDSDGGGVQVEQSIVDLSRGQAGAVDFTCPTCGKEHPGRVTVRTIDSRWPQFSARLCPTALHCGWSQPRRRTPRLRLLQDRGRRGPRPRRSLHALVRRRGPWWTWRRYWRPLPLP